MKLVKFFQSIFNFPVSSEMCEAAIIGRSLSPDIEAMDVDVRDRDLLLADILVMMSRASQSYTNMTGSDHFNMTVKGEIIPLTDRKRMLAEAESIYRKYGEPFFKPVTSALNI